MRQIASYFAQVEKAFSLRHVRDRSVVRQENRGKFESRQACSDSRSDIGGEGGKEGGEKVKSFLSSVHDRSFEMRRRRSYLALVSLVLL